MNRAMFYMLFIATSEAIIGTSGRSMQMQFTQKINSVFIFVPEPLPPSPWPLVTYNEILDFCFLLIVS